MAHTFELLREGMRQGALGFGFGITYTPGATHEEIFRAFAAAVRSASTGICSHPRLGAHGGRSAGTDPGSDRETLLQPARRYTSFT